MATVELYRLSCGTLKIPGNLLLSDLSDKPEDALHCEDWAFLIKHKDRVVLWDSGLACDLSIYPPVTQKRMPTFNPVGPDRSLKDKLEDAGILPGSVTDVVFSHAHWDHQQPIHIMFPNATAWLGPGTTAHCGKGYPTDPEAGMFSELLDPEKRIGKVRELSLSDDKWSKYGPFPHAFDFFGDGALMLCNAPGHIPGNMCAVVRTDKGPVCLGGDCAHNMRLITGESEVGQWKKENGELTSMHASVDDARSTIKKIRQLKEEGVIIALAHDPTFEWHQTIE
ncbi:protein of unknown function [Taphrina deformans PYCC 5710]|uniref:Metallo-beta-lactamase domain-containing protein n=1 Tax=Taphrina deformans (strain PYCC 5710 / ATCC 11124 / CBS 356.35 / IMI 108563 / JCM 9778 / NBRC 8474) TaxID=1097556 RepID=R4XF95_TAPDE|nr:protein of unknown function [Taphrina deformans PYCC 5710]|eukprot:CCG84547.1 protein of unknown function [Taphrina deformans PYCC 5710]